LQADILIVGGGVGGCAAALAALRGGARVVLTEPTAWIGGQLTAQLVPPDEHRRVESVHNSASYQAFREGVREHYRRWYPLTDRARRDPRLNPGAGWASPICHEPKVGLAVLRAMLRPYEATSRLRVLHHTEPVRADVDGDTVTAVTLRDRDGRELTVAARYVLDATELGDLLPLAGVEHVVGRESRDETGEPHAAATADPTDMQSATWCFAIEHRAGENHTIDKPDDYAHFRDWRPRAWGGRPILGFEGPEEEDIPPRRYHLDVNTDDDPALIDIDHRNLGPAPALWNNRRIAARRQFTPGFYASDIVVVNWPLNDYVGGPLVGVADAPAHWRAARQLSLSVLYWLQTEAPRPDGGTGWPGLRPVPEVTGTPDGFAMTPYVRESRRIRALTTIREQDVSAELRGEHPAVRYDDSVGTGHYYWLDRHAGTGGGKVAGGRPHPFEIPLGALLPRRVRNLLAAAKNIGTTQITNGSYRMHPVEWSIGEAAGTLAALCLARGVEPHEVHGQPALVAELQAVLERDGVLLHWPAGTLW